MLRFEYPVKMGAVGETELLYDVGNTVGAVNQERFCFLQAEGLPKFKDACSGIFFDDAIEIVGIIV